MQIPISVLVSIQFSVSLAMYCRPSNDYKNYTCEGVHVKLLSQYLSAFNKKKVISLRIFDCKETQLLESSLATFTNVENLTVSCDIKDINKDAFRNFNRLQELDLGNNTISELQEHVFETLGNLYTLNLSRNYFEELTENMLNGLINLRQLIITYNGILNLHMKVLNNVPRLEQLDLSHNKISFIPVKLFSKTTELRKIDLSYNNIEYLGETFMSTYNLVFLNLSNNMIEDLPIRVFTNTRLEILDLSINKLKIIHEDSFLLEFLKKLYLQNNEISLMEISGQGFNTIPLNFLDLQNNRLVFLQNDFIIKASNLVMLKVEGNPWDCKCFDKMETLRGNLSLQLSTGYHEGEEPLCVVGYFNECSFYSNNLTFYYNILKQQTELR